jgi:PAS domain S-box-containing protein
MSDADYFQVLADGAPVMIWMSGLDMGCFYFNRAWLEFRGRTVEEEFGNGWAEGVHPDDLERCVGHYVSCFERRMSFAMSYRLRDHTGQYRWILDRGAPHYLPDQTFLGFFGGCAEIEEASPVRRNAELSKSLNAMRDFAQAIAFQHDSRHRSHAPVDVPLSTRARRLYAAREMEQLAADMAQFHRIERGACIP